MKKILVIDDDPYICNLLVNFLEQKGYKSEGAFTGKKGKKLIEKNEFDVILCDFRLPDTDGYEILKFVKSKRPSKPVIIMTAYAEIKTAVKMIKSGAFDYITKPIHPEEILLLIKDSMEQKKESYTDPFDDRNFVTGKSKIMQEVIKQVHAVAPTNLTVLLEGETGSGKEYIARAIHQASLRKDKPFIAVDCGAIPRELANSELFGHIKGAFTGAINDKAGFFEQAKGGTLFLDEVSNLPFENQTKLLRALQERKINRVGDTKSFKVDIRLIAASNEDLFEKISMNDFRDDLYHRLNEFRIKIPPLRERGEDIMEFVEFFIKRANISFNKNIVRISEEIKKMFLDYYWYGNIRELQNVINRAVLLSQSDILKADNLPDKIRYAAIQDQTPSLKKNDVPELKEATGLTEKEVISNALIKSNFNKTKAAQLLNIDRKTLYNKIKLYEIEFE